MSRAATAAAVAEPIELLTQAGEAGPRRTADSKASSHGAPVQPGHRVLLELGPILHRAEAEHRRVQALIAAAHGIPLVSSKPTRSQQKESYPQSGPLADAGRGVAQRGRFRVRLAASRREVAYPESPLERIPSGRAPREHPYSRRKCGSITFFVNTITLGPVTGTLLGQR
jgi:hypothetical protein